MTMNRERHGPFEELLSASLNDDLSIDERRRLDVHLDTCETCRATLAAFGDQRRIMAGLRHVAPPRDLGARVRTGIERGSLANLPWWRRPAAIFAGVGGGLAAVAGALLALVLLNGSPDEPPVGGASATPTVSVAASATPEITLPPPPPPPTLTPPAESAAPVPSATASASASADPAPTATPSQASPEPDVFLAVTGPFDNRQMTARHGPTGETIMELDTSADPIAAELSPDGQWLAYITRGNGSGINEVRATRIAEGIPSDDPEDLPPTDSPVEIGETVILGQSVAGSPFLERLSWSSHSYYLAYTLADPDGGGTDAWMFDVSFGEPRQLTDVGNAYAASWVPSGAGSSFLWVSTAGDGQPMSYLRAFHDSAGDPDDPRLGGTGDPADDPTATAEGVFQPLLSPNGSLAIYWKGRMERIGDEWLFSEGGAPYLAEHDDAFAFTDERPLFSDLTIGREAFTSAGITWGADGDAYAVWKTQWTGISQGSDGAEYPDERRVYFGHATDPRGLTQTHAIDESDIPDESFVVDVKVSPTGRHLLITAAYPTGGVMEASRADLLLVERNTGRVADEVFKINTTDDVWFGPAAFDALPDPEAP